VIANHQLIPNVQYPGGADDMQLAREWIYQNIASNQYGNGSVDKVVLFGHSSGGAHIASNLYAAGDPKTVPKTALFPPVAGVMYFSTPFWFDNTRPIRKKILQQYFGSDAEDVWGVSLILFGKSPATDGMVQPVSPLGLFRGIPDNSPLL
jgi:acetyl esterase/lipase